MSWSSVRGVLGNKLAGVCAKIGAHTPRIDVVAAANAAREARADALLTVGGGSVTDAAKMVGLCLGNDVTDPAQLDRFRATIHADGRTERPPVKPPACARSRCRRHCRPASSPGSPAAPIRCGR